MTGIHFWRKARLSVFLLPLSSRAAFPSLPSPPPTPPPKLLHPLSVSEAEVLHLIKQRRGRREEEREGSRQGHCKTQHVQRKNEGTPLEGGNWQALGKAKTRVCITICSICALPVGFNSVGLTRRFQLWYCRHQRQPGSRLLLKRHCSIFVCYR